MVIKFHKMNDSGQLQSYCSGCRNKIPYTGLMYGCIDLDFVRGKAICVVIIGGNLKMLFFLFFFLNFNSETSGLLETFNQQMFNLTEEYIKKNKACFFLFRNANERKPK